METWSDTYPDGLAYTSMHTHFGHLSKGGESHWWHVQPSIIASRSRALISSIESVNLNTFSPENLLKERIFFSWFLIPLCAFWLMWTPMMLLNVTSSGWELFVTQHWLPSFYYMSQLTSLVIKSVEPSSYEVSQFTSMVTNSVEPSSCEASQLTSYNNLIIMC